MASSKSASSTSSQTSSVQEDNRVVGEGGSVVLGKDAGIIVNQEFGNNVLTAFNGLVSLAKDAGELVYNTTTNAVDQANKGAVSSVGAVASAFQDSRNGTSSTESTITKYIPLMIGAGVVIFIFMLIFRKKG